MSPQPEQVEPECGICGKRHAPEGPCPPAFVPLSAVSELADEFDTKARKYAEMEATQIGSIMARSATVATWEAAARVLRARFPQGNQPRKETRNASA